MAPKVSFSLDNLQDAVANIFNQVQSTLANHKKNCVNLYKLHVQAASHMESNSRATVKLVGENVFVNVFLDMLSRVLAVKKGVASADRIIKFIGSYLKYANERNESVSTGKNAERRPSEEDDDDDTFVSRFVARLLKWILRGFLAKDKSVRYRSVFAVSEMILWLGQLDMEIYEALRENLIERLTDKESSTRAQAVIALARLSAIEDPNEIEEGEKSILELLSGVIVYDDEAEVRRAALMNTPLNRATVDVLLSCSRDVDLLTRKVLYSGVLYNKVDSPRSLTLVQREQVIKDGLGDREGSVRAAASKLIMKWFDYVLSEVPTEQVGIWEGDDGGIMRALVRFLELFDVIGGEQTALDALNAVFVVKPDYLNVFAFTDDYWTALTPESALLAQAFVVHSQGSARVDDAGLPMVTAFGFYIQILYNKLLKALQEAETAEMLHNEEESDETLEKLHKIASVLSSILLLTAGLDYGDEIGRRKAFSVVKDMLTHPNLPLDLVDPCVEVMKAMLPSEREFIRVIVEIVIDLQDRDVPVEEPVEANEQNNSFSDTSQSAIRRERSLKKPVDREEMTKEERDAADLNDLRCLMMCNSVLERVNGPFEDNSTLRGVLDDLIVPSVQRKELVLREKALTSLGLCSLIAKRMALGSFQLFSNECMRAPDPIRLVVLRVVFDLFLMYEKEFFGMSAEMDSKLVNFLLGIMEVELGKDEPCPEVLSLLCIGFSKLLLLGIVDDPKMLLCLLVAYVSPDTADNQEARQCLSYFFNRYSTAHTRNKIKLQSIFMTAFRAISRLSDSLDESQTMVTPEKFGEMLLAWSDPQLGLEPRDIALVKDNHANVAVDILLALYDSERSETECRILCHLLNQPLYWPEDLDGKTMHMIDLLLSNHGTQCPFDVAATTKALDRFTARFHKIYSKQLSDVNPRKYAHDDDVLEIYELVNVDAPDSDREMESWSPLRKEASNVDLSKKATPEPSDIDGEEQAAEEEHDAASDEDQAEDTASRQITPSLVDEDAQVPKSTTTSTAASAISAPISVTPKKKKGTKRMRTPDSENPTPAERKRNRAAPSRAQPKSESESDDRNGTPTPVKSKPRAPSKTVNVQKETRKRLSTVKKVKEPETISGKPTRSSGRLAKPSTANSITAAKRSTKAPSSKPTKMTTRGRRKLPTPPPPPSDSSGEEEEEVESTLRVSPELEEQASDDLATYSDEL
ncbi:Condensin complex subunit 3 [Leucoagaricus sp. SymC.cos]|nr:Condensin complex subunit 3 [Leucoagaricus sp. SymC.cos]